MASLYSAPIRKRIHSTLTSTLRSHSIQCSAIPRTTASTPALAATGSSTSILSRHQSTTSTTESSPPELILPPPSTTSSQSSSTFPQTPLTPTLLSTLPLLNLQSSHPDGVSLYATLHIHARPYLLTLGDRLRLPFKMPDVQPGDILRLTHASTLGTRDYTLRGAPWVDGRLFEARAVVAGVESEPMRIMEKTKRRNRKVKKVKSKHRYTEVLLTELRVRTLEELEKDGVVNGVVREYGVEGGESV